MAMSDRRKTPLVPKDKEAKMDDLVNRADGFRLGTSPSDDDVNRVNWIIDRQTARIEALERENARLRGALGKALDRLEASFFKNAEHAQAAEIIFAALQDEREA